MQEIVLGLLAITAGAVFCFNGYIALRFAIPIWGMFVGFATGAGLVSALTNDAVLAKPLGWIVGIAIGLAFGMLAYLYYAVSVVLAMASIGFVVASSLMVALNVRWNWLIIIVAVAIGVITGVLAIATDLPRVLLVVISAFGGAAAIVTGVMLLSGQLDLADLSTRYAVDRIDDGIGWYVAEFVLVVAGLISQMSREHHHSPSADWQR